MNFKNILNKYFNELNCSAKDLANESGLSQAVISRYKNGERIPSIESIQLEKLTNGLYNLYVKQNIILKKSNIMDELINAIKKNNFDYEAFSKKFDEIIITLKISIIEMSKAITFDPSYISRIRTGQRKPAYPDEFADKITNFIVGRYKDEEDLNKLQNIIDKDININNYYEKLSAWFKNSANQKNYIMDFFKNLDEFNLNDYIKAIKFDELKIPNIPFYKKRSKTYYGIEEMKLGELDFFKATVLSKSKEPIFMCSDMPIENIAKDVDFAKKWMFAIAMSLKKGLHLNIIHNLDRPFNEMMIGLESWIPIYMTGQVSPYYLKENKDLTYCHFNYTSGSIALTGECIKGFQDDGKYYLTNNKRELEYYKKKSQCLLKKANSLMDIYRKENSSAFNSFLDNDSKTVGNRHRLLSTLPLFTIDNDLLISILKRNNVSNEDIKKILAYKDIEFNYMNNIIKNNIVFDEVNNLDNDEPFLALENIFYHKKIYYTNDEYSKHLNSTKNFALKRNNYEININDNYIFHNIKITIVENNYVIISKSSNPAIHFIIRHSKLRNAIENFKAPIKEVK